MQRVSDKVRRILNWTIGVAILAAPIAVYIHTFSTNISSNREDWSAMGSAMSGIYGPIIALLGFGVLILQVRLQHQTTEHMFSDAYLRDARADVEFYLKQLAEVLDKPSTEGVTPRSILHTNFERATVEQLSDEELRALALALDSRFPHLQSVWHAMYALYAGLAKNTGFSKDLPYVTAKQKTIVMISLPTCVALDHYLYCLMGDRRIAYRYEFARRLENL